MRDPASSSGRGRVAYLVLLLLVAGAGITAWRFLQPQPEGPSVAVSEAAAQSGRQKVSSLASAGVQASRTGRPVSVSETFTDSELSSLANDEAQTRGLPLDQVLLHATSQNRIEGRARAYAGGQRVPISFEVVPQVSGDNIRVRVTRINVAAFPVPGPVADQLGGQLQQALNVQRLLIPLQQLQVTTTEGLLTVTGVAVPS